MERWAANTLRTLVLISLGGIVLVASAALFLLSRCALEPGYGGQTRPDQAREFFFYGILVIGVGLSVVGYLARGLMRSVRTSEDQTLEDPSTPSTLLRRFGGDRAVNLLMATMTTQIVFNAAVWFWDPHQNSTTKLAGAFTLYHLPYALLVYRLLRLPSRTTLACVVACSGVLVLQTLFGLLIIALSIRQNSSAISLLALPWLLHFAVLALAWKAIQETRMEPRRLFLLAATAFSFVYFLIAQFALPFTYIFVRR